MLTRSTLRTLDFEEALASVDEGACFVDVRPVQAYLDVHIPGSLELLYESGPGFNSRARDCIPLSVPLVLLDLGAGDMVHAAASLRGKGFEVLGTVDDGLNRWAKERGTPGSTEVTTTRPEGATVVHVNDPGTRPVEADLNIPIEMLWGRIDELPNGTIAIAAGIGVRAAIAVGMLERAGREVVFWRTR